MDSLPLIGGGTIEGAGAEELGVCLAELPMRRDLGPRTSCAVWPIVGVAWLLLFVGAVLAAVRPWMAAPARPENRGGGAGVIGEYVSPVQTVLVKLEYNETAATAMAVLAKIAYCDARPGIFASAAYSCGRTGLLGVQTPCEMAGFAVVPGSVKFVQTLDAFAYIATIRVLNETVEPEEQEGFLLTFRGSLDNDADRRRDHSVDSVPLKDDEDLCPGSRVHRGYYDTWQQLRTGVMRFLPPEASVACTGHGSGAALCALAMYELWLAGFRVLSSYVFSMPRVGNSHFAGCFDSTFNVSAPLFRITHAADLACMKVGPAEEDYVPIGAEVHYPSEKPGEYTVCGGMEPTCGCRAYKQEELSTKDTCQSVLAPEANFCAFQSFTSTCYLGTGFQWSHFGPALGSMVPPFPMGLSQPPSNWSAALEH